MIKIIIKAAKWLFSISGSVDARGRTALHVAVNRSCVQLLDADCSVMATDSSGATALHLCNSVDIAEALIAAGADVQATDVVGWTPLHYRCKNADLVRLLVDVSCVACVQHWHRELAHTFRVHFCSMVPL